jgi:hypothetical protein
MKNKYIIIWRSLGFILASFLFISAEAQIITFEKHYTTTVDKSGKEALQANDGGYIIAATTENSTVGDLDVEIIKTDDHGEIISTRTYGGSRVDFPNGILKTDGGDFFVVGYTQSFSGGDMNIYLLKLNQNGDTLFTKVYGGYGNDEGKDIIKTPDGNYLIIGASNSVSFTDNNIILIKINPAGDVLWTKYYGGPAYESARSVKVCPDGGYILAGKTAASPTSVAKIFLVKTNSAGDTLWTKSYSGPNSYEGKSIVANSDGTYTLAVDDSSAVSDSDVGIMKLDNAGGVIWSKNYGGSLKDIAKTLEATTDGGYILGCISRSFGWSNPDMWIIKLDANGDSPWIKNYGGTGHDHLHSIHQTGDGGYIAIGHARSFSAYWEVYFLKLDQTGAVGIEEFALNGQKFNIFPNPTDGVINLNLDDKTKFSSLKISNSLGQVIFSENFEKTNENASSVIDLKSQKPGLYFVTIESESHSVVRKLILN